MKKGERGRGRKREIERERVIEKMGGERERENGAEHNNTYFTRSYSIEHSVHVQHWIKTQIYRVYRN